MSCAHSAPTATQGAPTSASAQVAPRRAQAPLGGIFPANRDTMRAQAAGAVLAITPEANAGGIGMQRVELAGDGPAAERSFLVVLPPEVPLPLHVGDRIVWDFEVMPGPPTYRPTRAAVTDDRGTPLIVCGGGAPAGWSVDVGGEAHRADRGEYAEVTKFVAFGHQGQTVKSNRDWQRLTTEDGTWFVQGTATDVDGRGVPPDAGPTFWFLIVRGP